MIGFLVNQLLFVLLTLLVLKQVCVWAAPGDIVSVSLENGSKIRGLEQETLYKKLAYAAFKGLPYAEPPVGDRRFKAPVRKQLSQNIDAFNLGNICLQHGSDGSEDCLFLNIYSPDVNTKNKLPVMFYIHGGGFCDGSGNDDFLGPDFLIENDVLVVTSNYRLGVFGFMSLNTPEHSGNMGLKDQQLALRFVYDHIAHFGGDPDQITVFGHSAGAASAHLHVLTDSSGLFRRAIPMSGSAGNVFAVQPKSDHILEMFNLARKYDPTITTLALLKEWIIASPFFVFLDIYCEFDAETVESSLNLIWAPVAENPNALHPILLEDQPLRTSSSLPDIDVLFGFMSAEWILFIGNRLADPTLYDRLDKDFDVVLPFLDFKKFHGSKEYTAMLGEIRKFYFGNLTINAKTIPQMIDLMTDSVFGLGIDDSVKKHALVSNARTFYYRFAANTTLNFFKSQLHAFFLDGASHGDELCYIFRCNLKPNLYDLPDDSTEKTVQRHILNTFTNFAKYGDPLGDTFEKETLTSENNAINLMDISNDGLNVGNNPNQFRYEFWYELREKYSKIFAV